LTVPLCSPALDQLERGPGAVYELPWGGQLPPDQDLPLRIATGESGEVSEAEISPISDASTISGNLVLTLAFGA
jgi:hypothetical protein